MELNTNDIRLKFLMGLPVHIEGIGNFHAPNLTEIIDLTEEKYHKSLSALFFDKQNLSNSSDLEKFSDFQVLLMLVFQDPSFGEFFFYGLNLHLDSKSYLHPEGFLYFGELSEESVLTEEKFNYIKKLVRIANNLPETKDADQEKYDFATDEARSFWEKIRRKRELAAKTAKKEEKINLHSVISAVGWKSENFAFISKLNIYQIYDGFYRIRVIDNYNNHMTGIYTGNIDSSKIKLPDIDWANIIKVN
jgi:hypothetical protein